jgi:hypothetical protein
VAFYPSIPIQKCIDIVADLYTQFYFNNEIPQTEQKLHEAEIFIKCLKLGNEELILQYDNNMYLQK